VDDTDRDWKRVKTRASGLPAVARKYAGRHGQEASIDQFRSLSMKESVREGLLVDGAGAPLAEEDSGSVELLDGTSVAYHAIAPDNASALQRFHHRLSERSIYLRFFGAKPELSDRKAGYFTNVDGINRFALVALDPKRPEEIIAVVRGLGLALTRRLIESALKRGIRVLTGVVLFENRRMLNLLRDLGLPERLRYEEGIEYVEIELEGRGEKGEES
jgi:hypothetical protein